MVGRGGSLGDGEGAGVAGNGDTVGSIHRFAADQESACGRADDDVSILSLHEGAGGKVGGGGVAEALDGGSASGNQGKATGIDLAAVKGDNSIVEGEGIGLDRGELGCIGEPSAANAESLHCRGIKRSGTCTGNRDMHGGVGHQGESAGEDRYSL